MATLPQAGMVKEKIEKVRARSVFRDETWWLGCAHVFFLFFFFLPSALQKSFCMFELSLLFPLPKKSEEMGFFLSPAVTCPHALDSSSDALSRGMSYVVSTPRAGGGNPGEGSC